MESGERFGLVLVALTPCRAANVGTMRIRFFTQRRKDKTQRRKGAPEAVDPSLRLCVLSLRLCVKIAFFALLLFSTVAAQDPVETIRIDSDLVDLKVSVLGFPPNAPPPLLDP